MKNKHAIAAIFQNEAPYLKEWIDFHLKVGFDFFYLFDNLSADSFRSVLQPYIEQGLAECQSWPIASSNVFEWNEIQCLAYERAIHKSKEKAKWLAILDTDEFLFSPTGQKVPQILERYEAYGGVGVNWQVFGTAKIEQGGLLENLTQKLPVEQGVNHHIKSIVRPETVDSCESPHFVKYKPGFFQVNTEYAPFEGILSPTVEIETLRINHYILRDSNYFHTKKIPRLQNWWGETSAYWEEKYRDLNKVEDQAIAQWVN